MGKLHGRAEGGEERQASRERQCMLSAVNIERQAIDVLHHQVGATVFGSATVIEAGDVRMLELSQNLPFDQDTLFGVADSEPMPQHFDRDLLFVLVVRTSGKEDIAGTTGTQRLDEAIGTDLPA